VVDADNADRYRAAMLRLKLRDLALQVIDDAVDLLNHRLRNNLDLNA
jgi:hypothetical protein